MTAPNWLLYMYSEGYTTIINRTCRNERISNNLILFVNCKGLDYIMLDGLKVFPSGA